MKNKGNKIAKKILNQIGVDLHAEMGKSIYGQNNKAFEKLGRILGPDWVKDIEKKVKIRLTETYYLQSNFVKHWEYLNNQNFGMRRVKI